MTRRTDKEENIRNKIPVESSAAIVSFFLSRLTINIITMLHSLLSLTQMAMSLSITELHRALLNYLLLKRICI